MSYDAAHGIAAERAELNALARETLELGIDSPTGLLELPDAGYFGWHNPASGERILIDCGEVGPRYQPGHAHCDLLSFELDLARRPVVVDAGVSGYGGDPLREYARSTRAHNTVTIAGLEQSEVWGVFRVGRRATVIGADHSAGPHGYRFTGAYTPYHDRSCVHRRTIDHGAGRSTVTDRVEGADGLPLASFLHLHPDFEIEHHGSAVIARAGTTRVRIEPFGIDTVTVRRGSGAPVQGWHCPEFGVTLPAVALEMHVRHNDGRDFGYGIDLLDG